MKNFYKILVLIIFTIMLAVPAKTYALESPSTESTNESNELEVAVTNNEQDEELDEIKDIISDNIDVDLLESQGFDYDENNESLVEKEVVNEIEKKLDENNIKLLILIISHILEKFISTKEMTLLELLTLVLHTQILINILQQNNPT